MARKQVSRGREARGWLTRRNKDAKQKVDTFVQGQRIPFNRVFVPLYDYKKHKFVKSYLISDHGEVISFKGVEPIIIKQSGTDYNRFVANHTLYTHRAVWFSFAMKWLQDPQAVKKPLAFTDITSVGQVKAFADCEKISSRYEVHHGDGNKRNNCYNNLVLEDQMHDILTAIKASNAAAEKYNLDPEKLQTAITFNAPNIGTSTVFHSSDKVTRTRNFEATQTDIQNVIDSFKEQNQPVAVFDQKKHDTVIKAALKAAYFDKYPKGYSKPVYALYIIHGYPFYKELNYKERFSIKKSSLSTDVKIDLGDITELVDNAALKEIATPDKAYSDFEGRMATGAYDDKGKYKTAIVQK